MCITLFHRCEDAVDSTSEFVIKEQEPRHETSPSRDDLRTGQQIHFIARRVNEWALYSEEFSMFRPGLRGGL